MYLKKYLTMTGDFRLQPDCKTGNKSHLSDHKNQL